MDQTQAFCSQEIEGKFNRVDEGLGIMAGGDGNKRSADAMSKEVNNLVTGMAELACVSGWQVRFAGVLGDMMEKTEELVDVNGMAGDEMRDIVEQLKTTAQSVEEVVKGLRVRAGLQADTVSCLHSSSQLERPLTDIAKPAPQFLKPNDKSPRCPTHRSRHQKWCVRQDHRTP